MGMEFFVIHGQEGNRVFDGLSRDGSLIKAPLMTDFTAALGNPKFISGQDGEEHRLRRKTFGRGYGPVTFRREDHIATTEALIEEMLSSWVRQGTPKVLDDVKRMVTRQVGITLLKHDPDSYYKDLRIFLRTLINVTQAHRWPLVLLKTRWFRRMKDRLMEVADRVIEEHKASPPSDDEKHLPLYSVLADDHYDHEDARGAVLGTFLVGVDTQPHAVVYSLAHAAENPDQQERLVAEINQVFDAHADDPVTAVKELFRNKTLRGFVMETMRLTPITPAAPYYTDREIEFEGYRIPKDSKLFVFTASTNYQDQHFPNPDVFDMDRYERGEYNLGNHTYLPWGLGAHECLGANLGLLTVMVVTAMILRQVKLELVNGRLPERQMDPLLNPGYSFRLKVTPRK